jgi:mannose-6-phosphate isomerase-like protein (cupin superfamily)
MTEKYHGIIHDTVSWENDVDPTRAAATAGCQVFDASPDSTAAGHRVLARSANLAAYMRTFADGAGENGLHSHDDDGIWMVVEGRATFHTADGVELGVADAAHGVLVPAGTPYRFVCSGLTTLVRVAAAPRP